MLAPKGPPTRRSQRALLLLVLAVLSLAAGIGMRDPSPPDEPRFVLAAQHMIKTGDWLLPHRGSELYAHKPPLFMWTQAAAYVLVRDWRVAFLLPSLLAGIATLWLTFDMARRLWNPRVGVYASAALLVTLQFGLQAKRAQIDMLLVLFTTLSMWALLRATLIGSGASASSSRRSMFCMLGLAGFAAGVGTVTKGVGFLPMLALIPLALAQSPLQFMKSAQRPELATVFLQTLHVRSYALLAFAFVLGTAVWLLPLLIGVVGSDDPALHAYAANILLRQTAERYANPWHHLQPAWYYLQVMLTLWLPGALLLPWLLPAWWRRIKRRDPRQWVLLGWSLLVLLFFSLSPAKREVYIFPALPALCVAAAPLLPGLLRLRGVQRLLLGYTLALSLLLLATGLLGSFGTGRWPARLLADPQFEVADVEAVWRWLCVIGAVGMAGALVWRRRHAGRALLLFSLTLWTGYGVGVLPALNEASSSRGLMVNVGKLIGPTAELGLLGWREQQLLQADRPARDFGFERPVNEQWPDAAAWLAEAPQSRWLLVLADAVSPCVDSSAIVKAGRANRRDWWLLPGHAMRTGCDPALQLPSPVTEREDSAD